jgi:hypothetical protein
MEENENESSYGGSKGFNLSGAIANDEQSKSNGCV